MIYLRRYGSRVYGTDTIDSDHDFVVVSSNDINHKDFHVFTKESFQLALDNHEIMAIEAYYSREIIGSNDLFHFKLDKKKLREVFSKTASNSFVKCKKKLAQGDTYIGLKSMFHSIRILDFGIQLATTNSIKFDSCNEIYYNLMQLSNWQEVNDYAKPIYNQKHTQFKKVT